MLKVKILANEPSCSGPMQINMDLEPHQRKAVYIGVIVRKNDDPSVKTTYELFNKDLFYVGKNSAKTATLEIKMAQFAQVFHTHRPGTIPDLFGDVGGFSGIALSICGLLCTWHTFVVFKVPEKIRKRKK